MQGCTLYWKEFSLQQLTIKMYTENTAGLQDLDISHALKTVG